MTYIGIFSATLLALIAFKFIEPFVNVLRDKIMGWDKEDLPKKL